MSMGKMTIRSFFICFILLISNLSLSVSLEKSDDFSMTISDKDDLIDLENPNDKPLFRDDVVIFIQDDGADTYNGRQTQQEMKINDHIAELHNPLVPIGEEEEEEGPLNSEEETSKLMNYVYAPNYQFPCEMFLLPEFDLGSVASSNAGPLSLPAGSFLGSLSMYKEAKAGCKNEPLISSKLTPPRPTILSLLSSKSEPPENGNKVAADNIADTVTSVVENNGEEKGSRSEISVDTSTAFEQDSCKEISDTSSDEDSIVIEEKQKLVVQSSDDDFDSSLKEADNDIDANSSSTGHCEEFGDEGNQDSTEGLNVNREHLILTDKLREDEYEKSSNGFGLRHRLKKGLNSKSIRKSSSNDLLIVNSNNNMEDDDLLVLEPNIVGNSFSGYFSLYYWVSLIKKLVRQFFTPTSIVWYTTIAIFAHFAQCVLQYQYS